MDKSVEQFFVKTYIDKDYQVIITSNDTKDISKKILINANIFKIQDGKIIEKGGNDNGRKER
jgi:recombinational DNA repair ATPase RecF